MQSNMQAWVHTSVELGAEPVKLLQTLEPLLVRLGFWRFPHMDYFVRSRGDVRDVIGWRFDDQCSELYTVFFGVWVPEFEVGLSPRYVDETGDIQNMGFMHDLSLQLEDEPSFWWRESDVSSAQQNALKRLVQQVALPYFNTFASFGDVAEMVFYDQRYHNSELEQRLLAHPYSALFHYEIDLACEQVVTALKPLQKLDPAFEYTNGVFWRRRGEVFDVIATRYVGNWRFVQIRTMVWHPELDGVAQLPEELPAGFSQVAWRSFDDRGRTSSLLLPAFLGEEGQQGSDQGANQGVNKPVTLDVLMEGIRSFGLPWLESIQSRQDVFNAIRPEYRKFYPD